VVVLFPLECLLGPSGVGAYPLRVGLDGNGELPDRCLEVILEGTPGRDELLGPECLGELFERRRPQVERDDPFVERGGVLKLLAALPGRRPIGRDDDNEGVASLNGVLEVFGPLRSGKDVLLVEPDFLSRADQGLVEAYGERPIEVGVGDERVDSAYSSLRWAGGDVTRDDVPRGIRSGSG
jgi:hypothetical protein